MIVLASFNIMFEYWIKVSDDISDKIGFSVVLMFTVIQMLMMVLLNVETVIDLIKLIKKIIKKTKEWWIKRQSRQIIQDPDTTQTDKPY